jgi:hypothetical protein
MDDERAARWWEEVEAAAQDGTAPDPWAAIEAALTPLTPDQEAFLAALDDQPRAPRLRGLGSGPAETAPSTGKSPGDTDAGES